MVKKNKILSDFEITKFEPPKALSHSLTQTIVPYYLPQIGKPLVGFPQQITLPDNDIIVVSELRPKSWKDGGRIVVLIHGLAGSQDSPYILRLSKKFFAAGFLVIQVNLRSCGPGRGLAKKPYHSGRSEDAKEVILWLQEKYPNSPITQIGFSLSANITIKMMGENHEKDLPQLDSAIAVSPPLDLVKSAHKITNLSYGLFDKFFLWKLKKDIQDLKEDFPGEIDIDFPRRMNMVDFDNLYTAPRSGFKDAMDYYLQVSSKNFVPQIKTKTLILHSIDDPVVSSECLLDLNVPDCIDVVETSQGGHVGFFDANGFWMDKVLLRWVKSLP